MWARQVIITYTVVILWLAACGETRVKLPAGGVMPAVIGFGDSIIDQGMNNYIPTVVKCNFPPYGADFMGKKPTGRFTNGNTPIDLVADELGIKELVPAYLDPNLQPGDLKTGVSFASGGTGYDPLTSQTMSVVPMSAQLDYFKEYLGKLKAAYGENETKFITDNSLFLVVAGSNDIANTYFTVGARRIQYDVNSYTDLMVGKASSFIRELYGMGARRIGVFSQVPVGCMPAERTLAGGGVGCAEKYNEASKLANSKFQAEIESLSITLPDATLVLLDLYNPLLQVIQNPAQYGLEVADKGCCGTGNLEVAILCNQLLPTCEDHEKYLFWDSFHPTEKVYRILVKQLLPKYHPQFFK
ncbi:unnamed protein product [Cuscuta campestris]|uniref:SGNH hydrolase-type esterase domain-containing protein n=1 Tax=Cuscuta campestris TaxID=132261 RepID=A0A484LKU1_9ASTE|nr:unnamed protein product [Cuscuta campestris]